MRPEPRVDESCSARWRRRALTIPAWLLAFVAIVVLLPFLLPVTVAVDLVRDRRLPRTRLLMLAAAYLACETLGIVASFVLWLATLGSHEHMLRAHYALQNLWARALLESGRWLLGLRFVIEGEDAVRPGPLLLFVRHTSLADTLLPAVFVAQRHGVRLRWVLKRELLWDPCLDLVGQRLPNVFVRRASADGAREIAAIRALAAHLGTNEGVLIYPEGTRFTTSAQQRAHAALARTDPERAARLSGMRHVLPPRLGGPLALLDAEPPVDVVFLAHVGFDGAARLGDVWRGGLVGRTVRMCFRRVPGSAVPTDPQARAAWLDREWAWLDGWVTAALAAKGTPPRAPDRSWPAAAAAAS